MKIAVPTRDNMVDAHFGHCEAYAIFTINEQKEIENIGMLPAPQGCGCKSNIGAVLQQLGVTVMLAGNMGAGAVNVLNNHGMDVVRGCQGDVQELVKAYLNGGIADSAEVCSGHGDDHTCSH